jgi:hypothetical protein
MDRFVAIILICLSEVPPESCTEETAIDVIANQVRSEIECTTGWQEDVGRSPLREEIGKTAYVKTLCRRTRPRREAPPRQ